MGGTELVNRSEDMHVRACVPARAREIASTPTMAALALPSRAVLTRRVLVSALVGSSAFSGRRAAVADSAAGIRFQADDSSFDFELPAGWVGTTTPENERQSGHLISVFAQSRDGTAGAQALVDGGFRNRKYGSSLSDLGSLKGIADRLAQEELLNEDDAKFASVVSAEQVGGLGGTSYYLVRYQLGYSANSARPAIAKLAVIQQRLYCIKVKAAKPAPLDFFEKESPLRSEMESLVESYRASAVDAACLQTSNAGKVPGVGVCRVLRP